MLQYLLGPPPARLRRVLRRAGRRPRRRSRPTVAATASEVMERFGLEERWALVRRRRRAGRACRASGCARSPATRTCCSTSRGCSPTRTCSSGPRARLPRPRPGLHPALARDRGRRHALRRPHPLRHRRRRDRQPRRPDPGLRARLDRRRCRRSSSRSGRSRPRLERRAATTVGHWRSYGSIHHDGVHYGQKAHSLRPLIDLPRPRPGPARAGARDPSRRAGRPRRAGGERLGAARPGRGRRRPRTTTAASCRARGRSSGSPSPATWRLGLRLVQRSQRLLPGLRPAGDRPGHRLRPPAPDRRGPARVLGRRRRGRGDRGAGRATTSATAARRASSPSEHLDSDRVLGSLLERLLP